MTIQIIEIPTSRLDEYGRLPSRFEARSVLKAELVDDGLGGIRLVEIPVEKPYIKDYDLPGEHPSDWPRLFDVRNWGFFLALLGKDPVGAAAVAFRTGGVHMLEGRSDLSALWDIRVAPEGRGAGIPLFEHAAEWSRTRGCTQMKVETQDTNLPACRFYRRMGCRLGEIRRFAYSAVPEVAHEVMLAWYLDLSPP